MSYYGHKVKHLDGREGEVIIAVHDQTTVRLTVRLLDQSDVEIYWARDLTKSDTAGWSHFDATRPSAWREERFHALPSKEGAEFLRCACEVTSEGENACAAGQGRSANPYPDDSQESRWWGEGHMHMAARQPNPQTID